MMKKDSRVGQGTVGVLKKKKKKKKKKTVVVHVVVDDGVVVVVVVDLVEVEMDEDDEVAG